MEGTCREAVWSQATRRIGQALAEQLAAITTQIGERPDEAAYAAVSAALDEALTALERLGVPTNRRSGLCGILWSVAGAWLGRGWLQTRAFAKPRGYAGDYELLTWIYERRVSPDPLGRLLDRYFQEQAAPQAVRHRMALMSQWIRDAVLAAAHRPAEVALLSRNPEASLPASPHRPAAGTQRRARVAILGSVTGLEVRQALQEIPADAQDHLEIILLDYDPAALVFAQEVLTGWLPSAAQLATAAINLARLPRRAKLWEHAPCDLILVPGLLDYLDDAAAAELVAWGSRQLAPGGRLVLFQFAPHHATRPYMEWIGNWHLIYRDRAALAARAHQAGLSDRTFQIAAEPLGIVLYLSVTRPETGA